MPSPHIIHPRPDQPQEGVDRFGVGKVIAAFGHMAVVIDPARQNLHLRHDQRRAFGCSLRAMERRSARRIMGQQHFASAPVALFQGAQEADQVLVADTL